MTTYYAHGYENITWHLRQPCPVIPKLNFFAFCENTLLVFCHMHFLLSFTPSVTNVARLGLAEMTLESRILQKAVKNIFHSCRHHQLTSIINCAVDEK